MTSLVPHWTRRVETGCFDRWDTNDPNRGCKSDALVAIALFLSLMAWVSIRRAWKLEVVEQIEFPTCFGIALDFSCRSPVEVGPSSLQTATSQLTR